MATTLSTVFLLGLAALVVWGRRRLAPIAAPLRIVARSGLTQKAGLALVEVEGRRLLVGYGDGAPAILAELAKPPADVSEEEVAS